ncbi:MAG: hypothetical protein RJA36_2334 [Pseudomonadota bacterium]
MTDDRALLEAAARAAGYSVVPYTWNRGTGWDHDGFRLAGQGDMEWNPLEDDGDRYRLARTLGLRIDFQLRRVLNRKGQTFDWGDHPQLDDEAHAIVRAAAAMEPKA